jgi:uncharacterized linocin/CFP29 family protein
MSGSYLHREQAPFGAAVWERIDRAVVESARACLAGRRLLPMDGPHGLAVQGFAASEVRAPGGEEPGKAALRAPRLTPLPSIECAFRLSIRDLAAFESAGQLLDLVAAATAARHCAEREDDLIFRGDSTLRLEGLLDARGVQTCKLAAWKEPGSAVDNVLQAVNQLDAAGFRGPYALGLTPSLHNLLFRRYADGHQTEIEHLRQVVTAGIVKAGAAAHGGVLVTAVKELACILVGQDLAASFVGPSGRDYEFAVSETVALRLAAPASVCVLK